MDQTLIQRSTKELIGPQHIICNLIGTEEEERQFKRIIDSDDYKSASSFREQVFILCNQLRSNDAPISFERVGRVFGKSKQAIWSQYKKSLIPRNSDGRPAELSSEELFQVQNYISKLHSNPAYPIYPSYKEVADFISLHLRKDVRLDTLRKIIQKNFGNSFKSCVALPLEEKRMFASLLDIELNLKFLKNKIEGVPSAFIFNCDEVGHSEYADAVQKKLIVPRSCQLNTVLYPVSRNGSHASCLVAISPTGLSCKPLFTVPRVTVDSELYQLIPYDSLAVVHTETGYVNSAVFEYWLTDIFLPHLRNLRRQYDYNDRAVLILDGFIGHHNVLDSYDLSQDNLLIHYLVPHTSDMLQPLDAGIFGSMKRFLANFGKTMELTAQSKQIYKIHQCLYQACSPTNCKAAFRATRIDTKIEQIGENQYKEIAFLDITKICKVRYYEISYIEQLIRANQSLSENQRSIYYNYLFPNNNNKNQMKRIHIDSFAKEKQKNSLKQIINLLFPE